MEGKPCGVGDGVVRSDLIIVALYRVVLMGVLRRVLDSFRRVR